MNPFLWWRRRQAERRRRRHLVAVARQIQLATQCVTWFTASALADSPDPRHQAAGQRLKSADAAAHPFMARIQRLTAATEKLLSWCLGPERLARLKGWLLGHLLLSLLSAYHQACSRRSRPVARSRRSGGG